MACITTNVIIGHKIIQPFMQPIGGIWLPDLPIREFCLLEGAALGWEKPFCESLWNWEMLSKGGQHCPSLPQPSPG